jgi:hypothetical protein
VLGPQSPPSWFLLINPLPTTDHRALATGGRVREPEHGTICGNIGSARQSGMGQILDLTAAHRD